MKSTLIERVAHTWPADQWRNLHVLVAVSGGPDSIGLLLALRELKEHVGGVGEIYACHINHQLRSADSDADQAWVERECDRLHIPLAVATSNVQQAVEAAGDGVEAAARSERYRLLTDSAERLGARFVAVGHHSDDQVETVLFRLFRGSGLRGLSGMPRSRPLSPSVTLVRPLLNCWQAEVHEYLSQRGQDFRTDGSNADLSLARNRLREELLPQIREHFNADVAAAVFRTSGQLAAAQRVIDSAVERLLGQCELEACGDTVTLLLAPLYDQSPYLAAEVLRATWRETGLPEQAMTHDWWARMAELATCGGEGSLNLPGHLRAEAAAGRLMVRRD